MLRLISIYSSILPILIFFLFFQRNKKGSVWVIFVYAIISSLTDFSFEIFTPTSPTDFYFFSIFTVLEYSFFSIFLYFNFKKKLFKNILLIVSLLFYAFSIYNVLSTKDYIFDSFPASIEAILIIIFCIFFFYEQINNPEISFIYSSKKFWIATAFLIYLSGTLFLFIYASNLSDEEYNFYWPINFIFNILKNILIALAFYLPNQKSQSFIEKSYDEIFEKPPLNPL